jgi:hypothetical protein
VQRISAAFKAADERRDSSYARFCLLSFSHDAAISEDFDRVGKGTICLAPLNHWRKVSVASATYCGEIHIAASRQLFRGRSGDHLGAAWLILAEGWISGHVCPAAGGWKPYKTTACSAGPLTPG